MAREPMTTAEPRTIVAQSPTQSVKLPGCAAKGGSREALNGVYQQRAPTLLVILPVCATVLVFDFCTALRFLGTASPQA